MTRAIGVVRVSQTNGREGDSFHSPDTQRDRIREACEAKGWTLLAVHEELDVSGGKPLARRPGLSRAVEAIEAGRADIVVVAYFDRLVRSVKVQTEVVERVEAAGGDVETIDFGRVTNGNATQRMTSHFLGAVAQYHRDVTAEKSREAQVRAIANGVYIAPVVPPGLMRGEDGRLVHDPDTKDAVIAAFDLRADRASIGKVHEHLRSEGIDVSVSAAARMLANRAYLGEIHFGDLHNPAAHEPLIDPVVWERAQRAKASRGRPAKSTRLLARQGVLRCGSCGRRMTASTGKHGAVPIYRCFVRSGEPCPASVTIGAEAVEELVAAEARRRLEGAKAERSARDNVRLAKAALAKAQEQYDGLMRLLDPTEPVAVERLNEARAVRDAARERVEQIDVPDDGVLLFDEDWGALSLEDQRRAIRAVIKEARVSPATRWRQPAEERVEIVQWSWTALVSGDTPRVPRHLS